MIPINQVFVGKAHIFMIYTSFCFWIIIIMLMSVWRMLHKCPAFITRHPDRQTDQVSVSEATLSQSEAGRVTHWPIRGQDRADHDTDAVMSGVMRGEAVTRSKVDWNTNTALNCLSERRRHMTVVRWGKPRGGDGEGGPAAVNTGRNIQLSVKFIPLVQDCSCGVTHTQRLLGSLFVHSEHFAKLDRNENV